MIKFEKVKNCPFPMKLPSRSTTGSAGYDFYAAYPFSIGAGQTVFVKTWVKAKMPKDTVLLLFERSSWGFKKHISIPNSVGVVDSDYYGNTENDGNIAFAFTNNGNEPLEVHEGDKIGQGVFLRYLTVDDDDAYGERSGGFGSTGR